MGQLALNFFRIDTAPGEGVTVYVRPRVPDQPLERKSEALWTIRRGDEREELVVNKAPQAAPGAPWAPRMTPLHRLPRGVVGSLLGWALRSKFLDRDFTVEPEFLGFACYPSADDDGESPFLKRQRGIQVRVDSVWGEEAPQYGCFARMKISEVWRFGLENKHLASACVGQRVEVLGSDHPRKGVLHEADQDKENATVYLGEDGGLRHVPFSAVRPLPSREIKERFFQAVDERGAFSREATISQRMRFRLTPQGRVNQGWRKNEMEYLRLRFGDISDGHGRSILAWPIADHALYLDVSPAKVLANGR